MDHNLLKKHFKILLNNFYTQLGARYRKRNWWACTINSKRQNEGSLLISNRVDGRGLSLLIPNNLAAKYPRNYCRLGSKESTNPLTDRLYITPPFFPKKLSLRIELSLGSRFRLCTLLESHCGKSYCLCVNVNQN